MFSTSATRSTTEVGYEGVEASDCNESLVAGFERVASKLPSRIAIGSGVWEPTYRGLNETANRLAHRLIGCGVVSGDRVAILMAHDAPLVAAVLGALKAASIVVALDPGDPVSRLKMLVEDAEPGVIVTDAQNLKLAEEFGHPGCSILNFASETAKGPVQNPSIEIAPEQTAFLTYTSGTTGRPKGVMKTHRQLRRAAAVHSEAMQYTENDRIPLFARISTGQGATALSFLLTGAMLCPFPLRARGVTGLADWIIARGLTVYVSSASIFRTLVKTIDDRLVFANVRAVRLASESVTADDLRAFRQHFPKTCILVHTLSSSETSNIAWSRWTRDDNIPEGTLPVGHFSRDTEVTLLGEDGHPVAPGAVGEIVVKSRYVANGYWRDRALTAERFSEDLDGNGTRLVRTGDRGRINADGFLEHCGRKDDRIKIRGNRIELLDIERTLEKLPGVDRVAVVAVPRNNHEPALVAFVVKKSNASLTAPLLRHAVRTNLPLHMVPSRIVFLEQLPYNKGNKIDREALRQHFLPVRNDVKLEQPQTETEMLLADIWAELFDLADISRSDDFFNLGGDSLNGAIVAARIHASLGVDLTLGDIADHPTVLGLAAFIDDRPPTESAGPPPMVAVPRGALTPASLLQELIWNHPENQFALTSVHVCRVTGPLNIDILKECLSFLFDRHEILRTTFGLVEGRVAQIIHPSAPLDFSFVDLVGSDDPEGQADSIFRREHSQKVDHETLPLMRHILIRITHDHYRLARIFSNAISDGSSSRLLYTELAILYEARLQGIEPPLPRAQSLQYADYATWQRQLMRPDGPYFREATNWWKSVVPPRSSAVRLPFRRLRPRAGLNPRKGFIRWKLERRAAERLDQFARSVDATHFAVRLAAFAALIADVTETSTVVIGTNFVCRNHIDTQAMVGPFVNTAPLILYYDASKTFRDWLAIVRDRLFETRAHSELLFECVRQQLRMEGIEPPEVQIVFAMSSDRSDQQFGNLIVSDEGPVGQMRWGCQFFVVEPKPENCRVNFDAGVYDRTGMRLMVDRYLRLLEIISHEPELPIGKLLAMTGSKPLRWMFRNHAERLYEASTLLKLVWRGARRLASSGG